MSKHSISSDKTFVINNSCMKSCVTVHARAADTHTHTHHNNWLYSPLWALASCTNSLQASLSIAVDLQSLIFSILRSSLTSSNHLNFWSTSYYSSIDLPHKIFRGILLASILTTCPSQSILLTIINLTITFFQHLIYFFIVSNFLCSPCFIHIFS
jgi:hypothetical protein